jgi:surface antigen
MPIPGLMSGYLPEEMSPVEPTSEKLPVVKTGALQDPRTGMELFQQSPAVPQLDFGPQRRLTDQLLTTMSTQSQRLPVIIKGDMKKWARSPRPQSTRRRLLITVGSLLVLILITGGTLLSVSPLGHDLGLSMPSIGVASNMFASNKTNLDGLQLNATATAVVNQNNDGNSGNSTVSVMTGTDSLTWPYGQCTYWANYRYQQLSGHYVNFTGNAYQWYAGAIAAGWTVSSTPHYPSIIVLAPGVQGASAYYGHVAVVESVIDSTSVNTSNWNWYGNGGYAIKSYWTFYTGSGVHFVWYPGT